MTEAFLFGIDLDGTLLSPDGTVSDRTRSAVRAILDAGHRVVFATGRNWIEAKSIFESVGHLDLVVLVSGAVVVNAVDGSVLRRWAMEAELASELCATLEAHNVAAVAYQDRGATGIDYLVSADRAVHPGLNRWLALSDQRIERRHDMGKQDHTHTLRVSTILESRQAAELRSAVKAGFARRVHVHSIVVQQEGVEIVEMFDPHVNKWRGLNHVAEEIGFDASRIIAIGDDQNDLPMIRSASLGVAMGNARAEVKAVADKVIGSNREDGLAVFLEQWLSGSA